MCEILEINAQGVQQDSAGIPGNIDVWARVTIDCPEFQVLVVDGFGHVIFDGVAQPDPQINDFNGTPAKILKVQTGNPEGVHRCGDRLEITVTCVTDPNCTRHEVVQINCKHAPPEECPDINSVDIVLTSNGQPVDISQSCIPSGLYTAEATGLPSGGVYYWTLQIDGVAASLPQTNPVDFTLPAGNAPATLSLTVIIPNCPPVNDVIPFPDRQDGPCPNILTFELSQGGQVVAETTELCGVHTLTVLIPVGPGIQYTFIKDGVIAQTGLANSFTFDMPGLGTQCDLIATADSGPCCPPVSRHTLLTSAMNCDPPEIPPEEEEEDVNTNDDFSWCGFLYGVMMVAVFAFIALWITSFAFFPVSAAVWIALGIAFALVLLLMAIFSAVCTVSACRRLRILAWMFLWSAIGCFIAWAVSLFILWPALIGMIIAAVIVLLIGLEMHRRGCQFLTLFQLP